MSDWRPKNERQHPPFTPGNVAAVTHGARSPRLVQEVADERLAGLLADPALPEYLRDSSYRPAVMDLCRAEAVVELLWSWLTQQPVDKPSKGVTGVLEQLRRHMSTVDGKRRSLGLDPLSRARLIRDLATTEAMASGALERLQAEGKAAWQERQLKDAEAALEARTGEEETEES